ncbi:FAD-dependent oxidoreductase [Serratia marcescens]|uniref:FAD-dependent oxidoreductase n=1 Tax=Serratia marcescens TaxID=615 RepID=UPI0018D826F5|nr:FAD-dependent oxidoreductase [Serratia marcescens]MBH2772938.1 FAD-dependent oxidoreductase [Serratia marcescens]WGL92754.1 FAD-dependent oxidoreductase [Serratia marcescens]HAV2278588.1 FAD-dependent oxidoreductase [Serratia marcescens]
MICLSYAWAASSISFNALSEAQRVEVCLDALEKIYGAAVRQRVEEQRVDDQSTTLCWEDEYGYNGGWRMANPGQQQYVQLMHEQTLGLDPQWNNGLYLAGEAMSWYGLSGWVDGAIKTGIQAAISAARKVIG